MFEARRLGPGQSPESLAAAAETSIEPPGSVPAGPGGRSGASRASGLTALLWALRAGPALMLPRRGGGGLSRRCSSTTGNLGNMLAQTAVIAVLAIGQLLVILTRGIDLSVGSNLALCAVVGALVFRHGHSGRWSIARDARDRRRGRAVNGVVYVWGRAAAPVHHHAGHAQHRPRPRAVAVAAASRCAACRDVVQRSAAASIGWLPYSAFLVAVLGAAGRSCC